MAKQKFSDNSINGFDENWGVDVNDSQQRPFSGSAVQKFIKDNLQTRVGYTALYTDPSDDSSHILGFYSESDYTTWNEMSEDEREDSGLVLSDVTLPYQANTNDATKYSAEWKSGDESTSFTTTNATVRINVLIKSFRKGVQDENYSIHQEAGTLKISTTTGNYYGSPKRVMSFSSIASEADEEEYTAIDVTEYLQNDSTTKIRLSWTGAESKLTRNFEYSITRSTFGLSFTSQYWNMMSSDTVLLNFATTGTVSKTLYLQIDDANGVTFKKNTDDLLNLGLQEYTAKQEGLSGELTSPFNAAALIQSVEGTSITNRLNAGKYTGSYWICTSDDSAKSNKFSFQIYVSDNALTQAVVVINNINPSISNWADNRFFDYGVVGANGSTLSVKFVFWDDEMTETYASYSAVANTKNSNSLSMTTQFDIPSTADAKKIRVRAYYDSITNITSATSYLAEAIVYVDSSVDFAPTSMEAGFILDPKSRSNNDANKEVIYNAFNNQIPTNSVSDEVKWTNMDWLNGGWVSDVSGYKCLRMLAGSKVEIPYDVFRQGNRDLQEGMTIEIDFKSENVSDNTEAIIDMSALGSLSTRLDTPYGLKMFPNAAYMYTSEKVEKNDQDVDYRDEIRTHLALNIVHNFSITVDGKTYTANIIRLFVNGVINREFLYKDTDTFGTAVKSIKIGSNTSDVNIYGIRIYKGKPLSTIQVQQDYVSTIPSINDKKKWYTANIATTSNGGIRNNDGTINYDSACKRYNTIKVTGRYPKFTDSGSAKDVNLTIMYLNHNVIGQDGYPEIDKDNSAIIKHLSGKGQGSTSKMYYKWNCSWKFEDATEYYDIDENLIENHAYYQTVKRNSDTDEIEAVTPPMTKLVGKLNYASSMQSHKQGSLNMYEAIRERLIGSGTLSATDISKLTGSRYEFERFDLSRLALREDEFLLFVEDPSTHKTEFYGLMTFGAAKGDKLTYGYAKKLSDGTSSPTKDILYVGGSNQINPLPLGQVPWLTVADKNGIKLDPVVERRDDEQELETWGYNDPISNNPEAWDYELGNINSYIYIADYLNFMFVNSSRLKPWAGSLAQLNSSNSVDRSYQYWISDTGDSNVYNVYRYDFINSKWVDGGVSDRGTTTDIATEKLNLLEDLNGITVLNFKGGNVVFDNSISTKISSYTDDEKNLLFRRARAQRVRNNLKNYADPNEILYCLAFTLFIAASDNLCKNSYLMVDVPSSKGARPKIRPWRDDDDTIFVINNNGRKEKPYWAEFDLTREDGGRYFTASDTSAYYGTLFFAFHEDLKNYITDSVTPSLLSVTRAMISAMKSEGSGYEITDDERYSQDSLLGCFNKHYFSIQNTFPAIAYNETARLLYEEAEIMSSCGVTGQFDPSKESNPIRMSMGNSLEGEIQYMKMRCFFMSTFAMERDGVGSFGYAFKSDNISAEVTAGAHMYVYSYANENNSMYTYPIRLRPGEKYTLKLSGGGTTDASSIKGTNYLSNIGIWADKELNMANSPINEISSYRLTSFIGGWDHTKGTSAENAKYLTSFDLDGVVRYKTRFNPTTIDGNKFPEIIEKIDLTNVYSLANIADFSSLTRLKELYLDGTSITSVILPSTNTLSAVTIPSCIQSIAINSAPNFKNETLKLEEKQKLVTIAINACAPNGDGEESNDYYGNNISWINDWIESVKTGAGAMGNDEYIKNHCTLQISNIEWKLDNEEVATLCEIKDLMGDSLMLSGIVEMTEADGDTFDKVIISFGDDALNEDADVYFKSSNTYVDIRVMSITSHRYFDDVNNQLGKVSRTATTAFGKEQWTEAMSDTTQGSFLTTNWSADYEMNSAGMDIQSYRWEIDAADQDILTISGDSYTKTVTILAKDSDKVTSTNPQRVTLHCTVENNEFNAETGEYTVKSYTYEKKITVVKPTYPNASDFTLTTTRDDNDDKDLINAINTEFVYTAKINNGVSKRYTGEYEIEWTFTTDEAKSKTILVTPNDEVLDKRNCIVSENTIRIAQNEQMPSYSVMSSLTVKLLLKNHDYTENVDEIVISRVIVTGFDKMGAFGDVLCSDGTFARPTFVYTETSAGSGKYSIKIEGEFNGQTYSGATYLNQILEGREPIGIVVVPREHTDDNSCRVMSLKEMSLTDPDKGALSHIGICWGGYPYNVSSLPDLSSTPTFVGSNSYSRLGSETNYNGNFKYANLTENDKFGNVVDKLWYYSTSAETLSQGSNELGPSPYMGEAPFDRTDEKLGANPKYKVSGKATGDYDGYGNTEKILKMTTGGQEGDIIDEETGYYVVTEDIICPFNSGYTIPSGYTYDWRASKITVDKNDGNGLVEITNPIINSSAEHFYPAAECCYRYHCDAEYFGGDSSKAAKVGLGGGKGDWYLPSCGELGYIIPKMRAIQVVLEALQGASVTASSKALTLNQINPYWASSEYNSYYARYVYTSNGYVDYGYKGYSTYVRAFLRA